MQQMVGSPPHVRGLPSKVPASAAYLGITPACAGTTFPFLWFYYTPRDHPRMCGDYYPSADTAARKVGSPPHVRGLLEENIIRARSKRITPACAGTTASGARAISNI